MFDILHLNLLEYWTPCGFLLIFITNSFFPRFSSKNFVNSSSLAISFAISDVKICFGNIENRWDRICSDIFSIFCSDIFGMLLYVLLFYMFLL